MNWLLAQTDTALPIRHMHYTTRVKNVKQPIAAPAMGRHVCVNRGGGEEEGGPPRGGADR